MRKGFRHSLEPPVSRRVNLDGRRPVFCVVMTTAVITLITAIFGVSAWSLSQHRFGRNQFEFHAGDQISLSTVSDDLTSAFCNSYQVTLTREDDAYLLRHRSYVNQSLIATSSFALHHEHSRAYTFLEVYLLPGSKMWVGACRENGSLPENIRILLIKGSSNFNKWTKNPSCDSCVLRHVNIVPSEICGPDDVGKHISPEQDTNIIMNATFTETDRYALVVHYATAGESLSKGGTRENTNQIAGVVVSGIFNRTRYDTANSEKYCHGSGICELDLQFGTDPDVVVDFTNPSGRVGEARQQRLVMTKCKARYSFWLLIFLGVPLILGVPVAGVFWWFLCRRSRKASLKRLSKRSEKRVKSEGIIAVRDDRRLVANEVLKQDGDECMGIQDD